MNDVRFCTVYLSEAGEAFATARGQAIVAQHAALPRTEAALDADHSGDVTPKDASFMNKVNVGIFSFVENLTATVNETGCAMAVRARVVAKGDAAMLGGLKLQIGDQLIDASLATRLRRMRERLTGPGAAAVRGKITQIIEGK